MIFNTLITTSPTSTNTSLLSLSIKTPPTKTTYIINDTFDPSGMVVTATFSNNETIDVYVSSLTIAPSTPLSTADTHVTVNMSWQGVTKSIEQPINVLVQNYVFGVMWDSSNPSTALTRLTTTNDPNGFVNVNITDEPVAAVGTKAGFSPFDNYLPWNGMEEYNIISNAVAYKRGDAGFSRTNYDTMVYIPKFYYKIVVNGDNWYFYLSDMEKSGFELHPGSGKYIGRYEAVNGYNSCSGFIPTTNMTRDTARKGAQAKGNKWSLNDFATWRACCYLYLIEYADWNSQAKIGYGNVNNTAPLNSGETDSMTYHTGRATGILDNNKTAIQYRHIENPFGNKQEYIDGVNIYNRKVYVCTDFSNYADDTMIHYTDTGAVLPEYGGWIKSLYENNNFSWMFLPSAVGGSESSFIPDYLYVNSGWTVLFVGGYHGQNTTCGFWQFNAYNPSSATNIAFGARLLYHP